MKFGNCYTFTVVEYRRYGGWMILRRSVKSWVPHMQWGSSGSVSGATRMPSWWAGFRKIMGPDRGYLLWNSTGVYWRARINALSITEYLPPPWVDYLISNYLLFRIFPLHALVFFGWVRRGEGEQTRTQNIIDRTWPDDGG